MRRHGDLNPQTNNPTGVRLSVSHVAGLVSKSVVLEMGALLRGGSR